MCRATNISSFAPVASPVGTPVDKKATATWADVDEWRNAIDFNDSDCNLDDLPPLDNFEFSELGIDLIPNEFFSQSSTCSSDEDYSSPCEVAKPTEPQPAWCPAFNEAAAASAPAGEKSKAYEGAFSVRVPKWKKRNAAKHLEGERHRRLKKKGNLQALKEMLPKATAKGKATTNDVLLTAIAEVREMLAKEQAPNTVDFRGAMRSSQQVATVALDSMNYVVEASESFLEFVQWPKQHALVGQHVSCVMHPHDAMQLGIAIQQDRSRPACHQPIASQIVGLARFVRGGDVSTLSPAKMDVSVMEHATVISFRAC